MRERLKNYRRSEPKGDAAAEEEEEEEEVDELKVANRDAQGELGVWGSGF